jgi:hypothetical protein
MDPQKRMAGLVGAVLASACGGGATVPLQAFESVVGQVDGGAVGDADGGQGLIDLGQGIQLSRARFVVASLSLAGRPDADGGVGQPGNGRHVTLGPIVGELTQAGDGGVLGFTVGLPAGRFAEARFVVGPAGGDGGLAVPDGDAGVTGAPGGTINASFAIEGIVGDADGGGAGAPFSFVSTAVAGQTAKPSDGDGGTQSVTLTVDPSAWFTSSSGARLDPTDPASHEAIEDNIQLSIRVGSHGDGGQ